MAGSRLSIQVMAFSVIGCFHRSVPVFTEKRLGEMARRRHSASRRAAKQELATSSLREQEENRQPVTCDLCDGAIGNCVVPQQPSNIKP